MTLDEIVTIFIFHAFFGQSHAAHQPTFYIDPLAMDLISRIARVHAPSQTYTRIDKHTPHTHTDARVRVDTDKAYARIAAAAGFSFRAINEHRRPV